MSKNLTPSFEPYNPDSMIKDYISICNQLHTAIITLNNGRDVNRRTQISNLVKTLTARKLGFEKQFELENIEYIKR